MKQFLSLLFLVVTISLFAQQPISVHLTEKDGLPDNVIYSVTEDDNEFIWLSTGKGLYRYDGNEYKLFAHPEQVGLSVFSIKKDADNIIWFTNLANQLFYIKEGKVVLFTDFKDFFSGNLFHIATHNNLLVLTTSERIIVINRKSKKVLYQQKKTPIPIYTYPYFKEHSIYFLGVKGEQIKLDKDFKFTINRNKNSEYQFLINTSKRGQVFQFKPFNLYIRFQYGNNLEIFNYSKNKGNIQFNRLEVLENISYNGIKRIANDIYILTSKGILIYAYNNNTIEFKQTYLINKNVTDVIRDKENNYWFSTLNNGMYIIPDLSIIKHFNLKNEYSIEKSFKGKENEIILKASNDSIYFFNTNDESINVASTENISKLEYAFYNQKRDSYFIFHTILQEVLFKDKRMQLGKKYRSPIVKSHYYKNQNEVFFATNTIIGLYDINLMRKDYYSFKNMENYRGYSCLYDNKTNLSFFGTVKGLFSFDDSFNRKEILHNNASIYIQQIIKFDDNSLWGLSFKNGLFKLKGNKIVKHYTIKNGLLSDVNSFITIDKNSLWIAGEKGLQKLNTQEDSFENLSKINGITSKDVTFLKCNGDRMYVVTNQEIFSFNIEDIFKENNKFQSQPYFTQISVDDNPFYNTTQLVKTDEGKNLKIKFNVNGFLSSENTEYQYRLIDKSKENSKWNTDFIKVNEVLYNKLAQGNYIFQLRAKRGDNLSKVINFKISVTGHFYKQWWFFLLMTISIGFVIWLYFKRQNNRLKERQFLELEKQNKEVENIFLKLENLRSQMNPHFVFNALNSIQDYILNNQKHLAGDYLGKFADLIRKYLDQSAQKEIHLRDEIETLESYLELEKLRFEHKLSYKITVANSIDVDDIKIPTILIQPYIENALKHGLLHKNGKGTVHLDFNLSNEKDKLIITIIDDGVGRKKASNIQQKRTKKYKSFATQATKNRLELLNYNRDKKITIEVSEAFPNQIFVGTKVMIQIPL